MSGATVLVFDDLGALADEAARRMASGVSAALAKRGSASLALSGGTSPREAYRRLAALPVDWPRVELLFADERCVPPEDSESNYRLVRECLLDHIRGAGPVVRRMRGEAEPTGAAREYERLLPPRLDVLLLGVGSDGHTASLFPGAPTLERRDARVLAVVGPEPTPRRITLAPAEIERARRVLVLVQGARKAPAVARALEGDGSLSDVPARIARERTWLLDRSAASELSRERRAPGPG